MSIWTNNHSATLRTFENMCVPTAVLSVYVPILYLVIFNHTLFFRPYVIRALRLQVKGGCQKGAKGEGEK